MEVLEEMQSFFKGVGATGFSASSIAFFLQKRTPAGLALSAVSLVSLLEIGKDYQTMTRVYLEYSNIHKYNPGEAAGIYRIYRHKSNMLIPGSDEIILEFYDVKTGSFLGGVNQGAFGF